MNRKRIHRIYGWITTIGLLVSGVCLIRACISIYRMGNHPFSPERVAIAFSRICVPVYICLGLIGGGFLLQLFLPLEKKRTVTPQLPMQLARLQEKLDVRRIKDQALRDEILMLRRKRTIHAAVTYGLLALCSVLFLFYGMNPANYHITHVTESMAAAMLLFLPCLAIPFGYGCFAAFYNLRLMKTEISLLRSALKETEPQNPPVKSETWVWYVRSGLLVLGLFLLTFGFLSNGWVGVLTKAVAICTECVGLG